MYLAIIILILIYIQEAVTLIREPASQIDNIRAGLSLSNVETSVKQLP